ncbi:FAD-dependent oxidoreductase [Pseudonocardia spinosispora]|uniref:FAD-dependent oxidoreductase n=1 Tax=Pseudonocardia spinosispora TaxID=103441 RepID=UPI00040FA16D|nr:FAD-dependent oxidoreductase [Pseudonocardia spinosispora]
MDVSVVGAGVIGLSTAIVLRDSGYRVRVLAAAGPADTTSAVAGATWFPYKVEPPDRAIRWSRVSRTVFDGLVERGEGGVLVRECRQFWRTPAPEPWWAEAVPDLHRLTELPAGFVDSYVFDQPVIDMRRYLPYLVERFVSGGGRIESARLGALDEAPGDVVVNCTGLGARDLVADDAVYPIRGLVVRVTNPGIDQVLSDFDRPGGESYVIPQPDSCILGGTADEHEWDTTADPALALRIRGRCAELDPRLADAEILEHRVGLRPARTSGVRLELESVAGRPYVHNYGHGGAGVTLSWGCAEEVVEVIKSA